MAKRKNAAKNNLPANLLPLTEVVAKRKNAAKNNGNGGNLGFEAKLWLIRSRLD